jgi:hypothetical protein
MERLPIADQVVKESVNKSRLSQSKIAADADDTSMPVLRLVEGAAQCIALQFTTHGVMQTATEYGANNPCRRLIVHRPYWSDESVTRLGNGLDVPVIAGLFVENLAKRGHVSVQVSLFDEAVRPNIFDQVFFRHRLTCSLEKKSQNPKDCRRNRLCRTGAHQNKLSRINPKVIKLVYSSCCQHAGLDGILDAERAERLNHIARARFRPRLQSRRAALSMRKTYPPG